MDTYERLAASVLVAHQRRDSASCLCGWSYLGRSHADHVASALAAAGALQVVPARRGESERMHAEHDVLRSALSLLVRLKDGPRDHTYDAAKPIAWQAAREVLDRTAP